MKRKLLLSVLILIGCMMAVYVYHIYSAAPAGNTIESRERRLNTEIAKGKRWSIIKEIELDDFIISAAYGTDNKSALAIFRSTGNGNHKFVSSTNRDHDEMIIGGHYNQWSKARFIEI